MKMLIVALGEQNSLDGPNVKVWRGAYIAEVMASRGNSVTLVCEQYDHFTKRKRDKNLFLKEKNYAILSLLSLNYKKNRSLTRLLSHWVFVVSLLLTQKQLKEFDLLYVSSPPIEVAFSLRLLGKFLKKRVIIDVQDLLPISFYENLRWHERCYYFPLFLYYEALNKLTYSTTLELMSNSEGFLRYIELKHKIKFVKSLTYYFSSSQKYSEHVAAPNQHTRLRLVFSGALSDYFDFDTLIKAIESEKRCELIVCGAGNTEIESKLSNCERVQCLGYLDQEELLKIYSQSHVAIAPYTNIANARLNYTNKFFDYLAAGLPILIGCRGKMSKKITSYGAGLKYQSAQELGNALKHYLNRDSLKLAQRNVTILNKAIKRQANDEMLVNFFQNENK